MQADQHEILIVDDNTENLRVLSALLEAENYAVRAATNGMQALETINTSVPDLVLLDVNLPEMNGLEVCRQIRANPRLKNLPVVFLSALGDSFNKLQGFSAGGHDYLTKPFEAEEVKVRTKMYIDMHAKFLELEKLRQLVKRQEKEIAHLRAQLGSKT